MAKYKTSYTYLLPGCEVARANVWFLHQVIHTFRGIYSHTHTYTEMRGAWQSHLYTVRARRWIEQPSILLRFGVPQKPCTSLSARKHTHTHTRRGRARSARHGLYILYRGPGNRGAQRPSVNRVASPRLPALWPGSLLSSTRVSWAQKERERILSAII